MSRERDRRSYSRSPSPRRSGGQSLYVRNVSGRCRPEELKELFEKFGDVKDVYIPRDYHTREQKEFAYIQFAEKRDADRALEELNGTSLHGRQLTIQYAQGDRKTPRDMRRKEDRYSRRRRSPYRGRRSRSRSRDRSRRDRSRSRSRSRDRYRSRDRDRRRSRSRNGDRSDDRDRDGKSSRDGDKDDRDKNDDKNQDDKDDRDRRDERDGGAASEQPQAEENANPPRDPADD
jgi:RNA recognition motif-containing protein